MHESNTGHEDGMGEEKTKQDEKPKSRLKKIIKRTAGVAALAAASFGVHEAPKIKRAAKDFNANIEKRPKESKELHTGTGTIEEIVHVERGGNLSNVPGAVNAFDSIYPEEYKLKVRVDGQIGIAHIRPEQKELFRVGDELKVIYHKPEVRLADGNTVVISSFSK